MQFKVIIPARYESSRLAAKVLLDIVGKPMVQHVYERSMQSGAAQVIIATDHEKIRQIAEGFGAVVCMTAVTHRSGTERLAETIAQLKLGDDEIVVNVQGDEPLIPPELIQQVAHNLLANPSASMATLCDPIRSKEELFDPNIVKVVRNQQGFALYFSRAPIAWVRGDFSCDGDFVLDHQRHVGIYAYRAGFIKEYASWPVSPLERMESLEQLRALWYGKSIHVDLAVSTPYLGVDTAEDLAKVRALVALAEIA